LDKLDKIDIKKMILPMIKATKQPGFSSAQLFSFELLDELNVGGLYVFVGLLEGCVCVREGGLQ
jgi:hypothetical protein